MAGTATAVTGGLRRRSQQRAEDDAERAQYEADQQQQQIDQAAAQAAQAYTPPAPADTGSGLIDEIQRLSTLHAQGALSDEEYSQAKAKLLA